MRPLTKKEKEEHHDSLEGLVDVVNNYIIRQKAGLIGVTLKEVGYGIPLDGQFFYFDYPYDATVDKFNADLATDPLLKGVDTKIHDSYYALQKEKRKGYIFYAYTRTELDEGEDDSIYYLEQIQTNLDTHDIQDEIKKFLPIMHSAAWPGTSYKSPVVHTETHSANQRLLILSKRLGEDSPDSLEDIPQDMIENLKKDKMISGNTFVFAFELDQSCPSDAKSLEQLSETLYNTAGPFLEHYFNNSVLLKIMKEENKSEYNAFRHSYANLMLYPTIETIRLKAKLEGQTEIFDLARQLEGRVKALDLQLHSLFFTQTAEAKDFFFPIKPHTILAILNYFKEKLNYDQYTINIIHEDELSKVDKKLPPLQLIDAQVLLWNLWMNACNSSPRDQKIDITCSAEEESLVVSLRNQGEIPLKYREFLLGTRKAYPGKKSSEKVYRGLEIIKDRLSYHNWNIRISVDGNNPCYTTIEIHFKS